MAVNFELIDGGYIDQFVDDTRGLKSASTAESRYYDLKHFYQWLENEEGVDADVTSVKAIDIRRYLIHCSNEDGLSPNTIGSRYDSLGLFYRELCTMYEALPESDNPMEALQFRNVKGLMEGTRKTEGDSDDFIHITPEEVDLMCEVAPKPEAQ